LKNQWFGERGLAPVKSIEQLVFVGLNGYAVALDRDTGKIVWSNNELKSGYVTLLLDGDRLVVSTNGYIFCLYPLTGRMIWINRMSGYGSGSPTSLISVRGQSSQTLIQQAAEVTAASQRAAAPQPDGSKESR
jgi:outer membrane protein assembly factor BamB